MRPWRVLSAQCVPRDFCRIPGVGKSSEIALSVPQLTTEPIQILDPPNSNPGFREQHFDHAEVLVVIVARILLHPLG